MSYSIQCRVITPDPAPWVQSTFVIFSLGHDNEGGMVPLTSLSEISDLEILRTCLLWRASSRERGVGRIRTGNSPIYMYHGGKFRQRQIIFTSLPQYKSIVINGLIS